MRQGIQAVRTVRSDEGMVRLCWRRMAEIGIALALTMAALLFVAWAAWAEAAGDVGVASAWARPTIGQGKATTAYMTITNAGETDDTLLGATSRKAERVELHQSKMSDDGIMRMRPVEDGLPIPAGGEVELAPGGYHMMVMGLGASLAEGGELPLTLEFAKSGQVEIAVPVRKGAGGANGQH